MQHPRGGKGKKKIEGKKKKSFFCQEAAVSSAECDFGQGGAECCLRAAQLGESCCLALGSGCESPRLGRREPVGEPAVVPGCCWGARERLRSQVGNAGHSFPHAGSVSANTLTVLFGLGFFCTAFFFPEVLRPQHPAILSNNPYNTGERKSYFPFSRWQSQGSGMAGFAQHHGKSWEAELLSRLPKFDSRSFAE